MAALTGTLIALTAANGINSAVGSYRQASAVQKAGRAEANALTFNAQAADQQATDALARGREAGMRVERDVRRLGGAQRAALAGQGLDPFSGSGADVQAESQALGAFDRLTIENNARREAYGYQVQAQDFRNRATAARKGAAGQASALRQQAFGTLLTTGAQIGNMAYNAPRVGRGGGLPRSVTSGPVAGPTAPGMA